MCVCVFGRAGRFQCELAHAQVKFLSVYGKGLGVEVQQRFQFII